MQETFVHSYLNENSLARLNTYYGRIADRGANVFISFAPINRNAFKGKDVENRVEEVFEEKLREGLEPRYKIISRPQTYIIEGRYFYDSDYHLTNNGARVRTDLLINDVAKALKELKEGKTL